MKRILGIAVVGTTLAALSLLGSDLTAAAVPVRAEVTGKVKAVRVTQGQRVRQGQILAILENDEQAARCAEAVTALREARGAADVAVARARVDQAYAAWYQTFVRAPFSGVVARTNLKPGDSIVVAKETAVITLNTAPSPRLRADASLASKK